MVLKLGKRESWWCPAAQRWESSSDEKSLVSIFVLLDPFQGGEIMARNRGPSGGRESLWNVCEKNNRRTDDERRRVMRSASVFSEKITNWDLLNTNMKPVLEEMPHLRPIQAELETLISQARALDSEQEIARSQFRELTRRRQEAEKQGESLRRRVASHLRGTFGFTSEQLIKFGVNPRPTRTRPRKTRASQQKPEETTPSQPAR
jgi:hypothetical protein